MLFSGRAWPSAYGKKLSWLEELDTDASGEPPNSSWEETLSCVEEERYSFNTSPTAGSSQPTCNHYAGAKKNHVDNGKSSDGWSAPSSVPDNQARWLSQAPSLCVAELNDVCNSLLEELFPTDGKPCWEASSVTRCDPTASENLPLLDILISSPTSCDVEGLKPPPHCTDDQTQAVHPDKRKTKSRRGRPPKQKKEQKVPVKIPKIWEFIRNLLLDPATCPSVVRWEDPHNGVFRFVNHNEAARLWGEMKKNSRMSYEKMSRAMRYHYKSKALEVVESKRLVYKFGEKAKYWIPSNANFESEERITSCEDATSC